MSNSWAKEKSKLFCILVTVTLFGALFTSYSHAAKQNRANIIVLPFSIEVAQELSNLKQDLTKQLRKDLQELGYNVLTQQKTQKLLQEQQISTLNMNSVKNLALLATAGYGVYGVVQQKDNRFHFDLRIVESIPPVSTRSINLDTKGIAKIQPTVQEIAQRIHSSIQKSKTIAEIEVEGNKILDKDFVLTRLGIREGGNYLPQEIDAEVKNLYKTGYFEDVKVYVKNTAQGKKITFEVKEQPLIKEIEIQGAKAIREDDILEAMETKTGSVLNSKVISNDLGKIRELYRKKGYYQAKASYHHTETSPGKAKLVISIQEGEKLYIEKVTIKGANKIDSEDLKDQLALSERGLFSWITGSGVLNKELLNRDAAALEAYYANQGFVDVQVGQPEVDFKEEGIHITFQVIEGPRYKVGDVQFTGDLITDTKTLLEHTKMDNLATENKYFDRSVLRNDMQSLTDFYTNYGYAFADANADLNKDTQKQLINVTYRLQKNQKVFIRRITVSGNKKTRENVIRRELAIAGGDKFSGEKLAKSKQRLSKLAFFESVDIETVPTSQPNQMDLNVNVKEKATGSFSLGAGYSSVDNVFLTGQIQENNFLGKGYNISFRGNISTVTSLFQLTFWNPHLYDGPLGVGFDAYNRERDYDDYDLATSGGRLKFAYTIGEYTRLYWNARLEKYSVEDIERTASQEIRDIKGDNWSRTLSISAKRDTTDKKYNPTKGTINTISVEYAGGILGGDDNFTKTTYDFSYYQPTFWKFIFKWRWKFGYLFKNKDKDIPDFEKFYLGGINSVRGYDYRDISCTDREGRDIGGYKSFFTNYELIFPIKEDMGLLGLFFFDAGDVWDENESMDLDLYKSIGAGIRWNSPLGPLRLEYGYPLDDLKDNNGRFEFSVGQMF